MHFKRLTNTIKTVFSEFSVNTIAKSTGFCIRMRDILPVPFVASVITALGDRNISAIADIHRTFNASVVEADKGVEYKPFHNKLRDNGFPTMMQRLCLKAMQLFCQQNLYDEQCMLSEFDDVLIQDGSSFAVHPALANVFAGRFTKISKAAVECHMTFSLFKNLPIKLEVTADKESEHPALPCPETLKNKLLLADRGYLNLKYFAQVIRYGGFFLVRGKSSLNPMIHHAQTPNGRALKQLIGHRLKDLRKQSKASIIDMDVSWGKGNVACRMICRWDKKEQQYCYLLTNLPRERYDGYKVMKIYRLRWQVELLFKEWKSHNNLKKFNTGIENIATGLIWSSLLALLLKRYIGQMVSVAKNVRISTLKLAKSTQYWLEALMQGVINQSSLEIAQVCRLMVEFIAKNAKREKSSKINKNNELYNILNSLNA